jgi:hypothetical protein
MTEPFTKLNVAQMADRAASEIEQLQQDNARLRAKADAYDAVTAILGLLPRRSESMGASLAWQLRKRAEELREPDPEAEDGA